MFILDIWHDFLYQPLFNLLIYIYNNWTDQNLGWAVVYMTLLLRLVLLPFNLIDEAKKGKSKDLNKKIDKISKEYQNDSVLKKQEIRRFLRKNKVSPWAKAVVLGIQAIFFLVLYQVFLRGVTGDKILQILYPAIDFPGIINTYFFGFDLAARYDTLWAGAVALLILSNVYLGMKGRKRLTKNDLAYFILLPLTVFLFLWILPMVKSLFFLTTMLFGTIIHQFGRMIFSGKKKT